MSESNHIGQNNKIVDLLHETPIDTVVQSVITKFITRSKMGKDKYGTDLDRTDLRVSDWITHAQEELMDGILYLEKLKKEINTK
jgi:hypothetical protein